MNDKPAPQPVDPARIHADRPEQLREWAARFGISAAELQRILAEVGADPDKVRAYLNNRA